MSVRSAPGERLVMPRAEVIVSLHDQPAEGHDVLSWFRFHGSRELTTDRIPHAHRMHASEAFEHGLRGKNLDSSEKETSNRQGSGESHALNTAL